MAKNKTCSLNLVFFPTPLNRVSPTTDWTFLSCIFHSTQFLVTTGLNVFQKGSIRFKIHAGKNIFCIAHCRFAVGVNGGPAGEGPLASRASPPAAPAPESTPVLCHPGGKHRGVPDSSQKTPGTVLGSTAFRSTQADDQIASPSGVSGAHFFDRRGRKNIFARAPSIRGRRVVIG